MARGIHLKQLKSADLQAIGVPNDRLGETADDGNGRPFGRLAEVDPALAQTLEEVRQDLETTLVLLDEALTASSPTPTSRSPRYCRQKTGFVTMVFRNLLKKGNKDDRVLPPP